MLIIFLIFAFLLCSQVADELLKWRMKLAPNPVELLGRVVPREVLFANQQAFPVNEKADWSQGLDVRYFIFYIFIFLLNF